MGPANAVRSGVLDLHAYLGEFDPFGLKPLAGEWEAAGVGWIVGVGNDVPTSEAAVDAAWSLPNTIAGVGLHPTRISADGTEANEQLEAISELATDPQVAVISDVGVDETAEAPRELQEEVLGSIFDVAVANSRSLLIHWNAPVARLLDMWDQLSYSQPPHAAILGFAGDAAEAQQLVERNFYFSISPQAVGIPGTATTPADVLRLIPAERLFTHSSARPQNGEPSLDPRIVRDVLGRLATARKVEPEELALQINSNLWDFLTWRPK